MEKKKLLIEQLEKKMKPFSNVKNVSIPNTGWIKAIRTALGMTLQQLANKLSITRQSMLEIEKREQEGSLTLKLLREVADSMEMQLVYGFVPKHGSIESMIDDKATKLAKEIVNRTSNSMTIEDQKNSSERIKKAIRQRAEILKREIPKALWD